MKGQDHLAFNECSKAEMKPVVKVIETAEASIILENLWTFLLSFLNSLLSLSLPPFFYYFLQIWAIMELQLSISMSLYFSLALISISDIYDSELSPKHLQLLFVSLFNSAI